MSAVVQDQSEIRFRLSDGSDIGPKSYPVSTSVLTLKESILAQWPKGRMFVYVSFSSLVFLIGLLSVEMRN